MNQTFEENQRKYNIVNSNNRSSEHKHTQLGMPRDRRCVGYKQKTS